MNSCDPGSLALLHTLSLWHFFSSQREHHCGTIGSKTKLSLAKIPTQGRSYCSTCQTRVGLSTLVLYCTLIMNKCTDPYSTVQACSQQAHSPFHLQNASAAATAESATKHREQHQQQGEQEAPSSSSSAEQSPNTSSAIMPLNGNCHHFQSLQNSKSLPCLLCLESAAGNSAPLQKKHALSGESGFVSDSDKSIYRKARARSVAAGSGNKASRNRCQSFPPSHAQERERAYRAMLLSLESSKGESKRLVDNTAARVPANHSVCVCMCSFARIVYLDV